ncbi:MAG: CPBP family glutamic-type intramembrane protease [Parvularcula sp.]
MTGLLVWDPTWHKSAQVIGVALFLPALGEELVFRGPLLIWRHRWAAMATTLAFVVWHLIEAAMILPEAAPYFQRPDFLLIVTLFGFCAAGLTLATGRLLPAVLCHWLLVIGWKQLFGGPVLIGAGL